MATYKCLHCNNEFSSKPSEHRKFCSHKCFAKWYSENHCGIKHHKYRRIIVNCSDCGKEHLSVPYRIKKAKHHFCNRKCYAEWKRKQPESGKIIGCANCGKQTYQEPHRLNLFNNFYCSQQCQAEWRKANSVFVGPKNPAWKGGYDDYYGPNWNEQRKLALEHDNYTCQICGAIRYNNNDKELSLHHIIPFDNFNYIAEENNNYLQANALDNLTTLCMRCHRLVENDISIEQAKRMNLKPLEDEKEQTSGDYECLICHRRFTNERGVYYHSKRVHNIRKDEYSGGHNYLYKLFVSS